MFSSRVSPVVHVEVFIARQKAPQQGAVDDFEPAVAGLKPGLQTRQDRLDIIALFTSEDGLMLVGALIHVVGVPQAQLAHGGVEADLVHVADAVSLVLAATVPDAVMQDEDAARLAHHGDLPDEVLVAGNLSLVDATEVTAWQQQGAAHLQGHIVREVHQLQIEVQTCVND